MPSLRSDPLDEFIIPDETHVQEHDLVADNDVIVGGQSTIELGVRGGSVIAGERVTFGGHIEASGDCRLDMWCEVADNVLVGDDAYLGERVHIEGELRVAGNLDIGDDVDIEDGFDANGWIVIRNPMPTIVFLFVYLSQLLRIGEEEKAAELMTAFVDDRSNEPVVIPRGSEVTDDSWRVSTSGRIGNNCRLHGNIRAESLVVGRHNEVFGSLRAREGITVGAGTEITGNVTTRSGTVRIGPDVDVRGDVSGDHVEVHRDADIEGAIRAREETTMVSEPVIDDTVIDSEQSTESSRDGDGVETTASETVDVSNMAVDTADDDTSNAVDEDVDTSNETGGTAENHADVPHAGGDTADDETDDNTDEESAESPSDIAPDGGPAGT